MTLLFASILFLGASATMPGGEETPASSPTIAPAEQKAAKPKKERKICRSLDKASSRIPVQVCKTAAQWSEAEATDAGPVMIPGNVGH